MHSNQSLRYPFNMVIMLHYIISKQCYNNCDICGKALKESLGSAIISSGGCLGGIKEIKDPTGVIKINLSAVAKISIILY